MKKVFWIAVPLAAFLVTGVAALPAIGAGSLGFKPTVSMLLTKPSNSAAALSNTEKQNLRNFVKVPSLGDKLTCTSLVTAKSSPTEDKRSALKAKNACIEVKRLFPVLKTVVSQLGTNVARDSGKVRLDYQAIEEYSTPTPTPTRTFTPEPRPTLPPDTSGSASEAQKDAWRYLIGTYQSKISGIQNTLADLAVLLVAEQAKLDLAIKYGDALRKGIQESTIASIRSEAESWNSDIKFYESLISTYQKKIDQVAPVVVPAGPSQAQIDSWNRLITLYESSINLYNSRVSSIQADLRKYVYWRSVAERYGDTNNVAKQDASIATANADIASWNAKINDARSKIEDLRRKISGN